jgi:hypothetical protein
MVKCDIWVRSTICHGCIDNWPLLSKLMAEFAAERSRTSALLVRLAWTVVVASGAGDRLSAGTNTEVVRRRVRTGLVATTVQVRCRRRYRMRLWPMGRRDRGANHTWRAGVVITEHDPLAALAGGLVTPARPGSRTLYQADRAVSRGLSPTRFALSNSQSPAGRACAKSKILTKQGLCSEPPGKELSGVALDIKPYLRLSRLVRQAPATASGWVAAL